MSQALKVALDGGPYALAAGPDRAIWVTLVHGGAVARIGGDGRPDDDVTVYPVGARLAAVADHRGPGRRDVVHPHRGRPDRPHHHRRASRPPTRWPKAAGRTASPRAPTVRCGSPGRRPGEVGRITTDGLVTREAGLGGFPAMITAGPDGALWFTLNQGNAVGRLEPTGDLTVREVPTSGAGPVGIAATHDDAVWFTEILAEKLGRIPMDGPIEELDLPGKPHAVIADAADGVWVSLWGSSQIARVSGDGEVITIDLPAGQRATRAGDRAGRSAVDRTGDRVRAAAADLTPRTISAAIRKPVTAVAVGSAL